LAANKLLKELGYIAHCFECLNREIFNKLSKIKSSCNVCGKKFSFAGPLWLGELYDKNFCRIMLDELDKRSFNRKFEARKILREILVEKQECPLFYVVDKICSKLKIKTVSVKEVLKELELRGFKNSITHFHKAGFRTDAKIFELNSIFRELSIKKARE
jgi:tRNA (guanine26-N2/guanine27-N2)-dimethyltransferase